MGQLNAEELDTLFNEVALALAENARISRGGLKMYEADSWLSGLFNKQPNVGNLRTNAYQALYINELKKKGYTPEQTKQVIETLETQRFWAEVGLAFLGSIGRNGGLKRGPDRLNAREQSAKQQRSGNWVVPKDAQAKLPREWGAGDANRKGIGTRWGDPANPGNGVRIDQGNSLNSQRLQQVDHVVVRNNGRVLGPDGKPIMGSIKDHPEAHILLKDWLKWKKWNSPN